MNKGKIKGKILVTPRSLSASSHPALNKLTEAGYQLVFPTPGRQPDEEELIAAMDGVVGYLAGVEPVSAKTISSAKTLKVISRNGVGVDNVDLPAAESAGIAVKKALGANSRGVAEFAFASILAAARSIPMGDASLKQGKWTRDKGMELEGKILGLIGCGRIGQQLTRFALAFSMTVKANDPYPDQQFKPGENFPGGKFSYTDFDEVIRTSDIISLHCPPSKTGFIIDKKAIESMKHGVILVNTARAGLIDETAAISALETGQIRCLTNDAYPVEPPADWTLVSHPRVIASAHCGGFTKESVDRATMAAVDNLLEILET